MLGIEQQPAVLPHRLHGAVRPANSLLEQVIDRLGRFGEGIGLIVLGHAPPELVQRQGQIAVLGQVVGGVSTGTGDRRLAPRRARARNDRDALDRILRRAVQPDLGEVLQGLPPGQEIRPAVADPDHPRDPAERAVRVVGEVPH
ncbi:hypothetical protein SDC9_120219 [bioreactor metagenome]|uniref:Uncharacterized protein n=1 Tax=bioreactor metagenome TaxID=1076179 RepID=A0A645C958_9ZZZZ